MSDPTGLEGRLRDALGGEHAPGQESARRGADLDVARYRVVTGVRRRRMRRLQVAGGATVVALGLALGLPQVLGSVTPPKQATGAHAKHASFAPKSAPAQRSGFVGSASASRPPVVATCRVTGEGRTTGDCGVLATEPAARVEALTTAAASTQNSRARGSSQSSKRLGSPLVVRAGAHVMLELPRVEGHWRWSTPDIAGTPVYHGYGPPVTARATGSNAATQEFLVVTRVPVTVVLEARDDVFTGPGAAPSIVDAAPAAVWVLELEVEAR